MVLLDGLLRLATYTADSLPGRLGLRIRRARLALRRTPNAALLTINR
jgi:hypothetical protein